jgi:hypothetical protein
MGVHGEEMRAGGIASSDDEVSADVTLVAEEVLLEECHYGHNAWFTAGGEGVEFEIG